MTNIMIRNLCNQMCLHCINPILIKTGKAKKTTHKEILERIVKAANQSNYVSFTGEGEPTMEIKLPEYIQYAKERGVKRVGVESNGMMFYYKDYVKLLKKAGLDNCIVTLFSHKAKIHDMITQVQGSFDWTIKGLKNLQDEHIEITSILHTINKLNYKDLKKFIIFIHTSFQIKNIGLNFIRPNENSNCIKIVPKLSQVKLYLHEALKYCKENSINVTVPPNYGVPICFLDGYERYSQELINSISSSIKKFQKTSHKNEKTKDAKCAECSYNNYCTGVPKAYAKIYGTNELKPKKIDVIKLMEKIR